MSVGSDSTTIRKRERLFPAETRRALVVAAIAWGVFGSAWANMVSGAPFVSFARHKLGASTVMFGLLSSLPYLGVLAQLVGSYWVERYRKRRPLFLLVASCNRLTWLAVAALPWVMPGASHANLRLGALLGLVMLASAFGHAGTPAWFSWFADLIPERIRGRYLGQRAALGTVTAVVVSVTVSWVIDRHSSIAVFTVIFATAAVLGFIDISCFWTVREPPMPEPDGSPFRFRQVILAPLQDRPFRGYLLYACSESFMFGLSGPFFWLIGLEFLEIGNLWSNLYIVTGPMVFTAVCLRAWGRACDRFGSRPLVTLGTVACVAYPLCWGLATPSHYHTLLALSALIGGPFGAAVQVGDMHMMLALTPRESRSAYLAMIAAASSLGWVAAPSLGGALAQALKHVQLQLPGFTFTNLHVLMLIAIVVRLLHVLLVIPRLPEANPRPTRELVRHLFLSPFRRATRKP